MKPEDKTKTGAIVLYGASGHAKVIVDILQWLGKKIAWIVDDNASIKDLLGYEVRPNTGHYDSAIVAIGNCETRKRIVESLDVKHWETAIHPSAVVSPLAKIGEGTVIMAGAVVNACAVIGKHCIVNTGATVEHDCQVGDFCHIAPGVNICGGTTIGEGSWIGVGSCAKQCIHIGKWTMIGAGSVVVKDIPDYVTAYGSPCRVMKQNRDNNEETNMLIKVIGGGKTAGMVSCSYKVA